MDEYKHYLYERIPRLSTEVNAGNLTKPRAIRRKLKCKSFDWFLREIAFDLIKDYPPRDTFEYAWGAVQSQSELKLCVNSKNQKANQHLEASHCGQNITHPKELNLFFDFTWRNEIRPHRTENCWDVPTIGKNAPVKLYSCHHGGGNQLWRVDLVRFFSIF